MRIFRLIIGGASICNLVIDGASVCHPLIDGASVSRLSMCCLSIPQATIRRADESHACDSRAS